MFNKKYHVQHQQIFRLLLIFVQAPGSCASGCVIKGATKVGLNLLIFTVHPMKVGATLMSSFLFNVAMVLLATQAAIQFCAQAFELYANNSAIQKIWGGQVGCSTYLCLLLVSC